MLMKLNKSSDQAQAVLAIITILSPDLADRPSPPG